MYRVILNSLCRGWRWARPTAHLITNGACRDRHRHCPIMDVRRVDAADLTHRHTDGKHLEPDGVQGANGSTGTPPTANARNRTDLVRRDQAQTARLDPSRWAAMWYASRAGFRRLAVSAERACSKKSRRLACWSWASATSAVELVIAAMRKPAWRRRCRPSVTSGSGGS